MSSLGMLPVSETAELGPGVFTHPGEGGRDGSMVKAHYHDDAHAAPTTS